jgi:hypothetical protein
MRIALRYDGFASAAPNIRRFAFHWDPARADCQRVSQDAMKPSWKIGRARLLPSSVDERRGGRPSVPVGDLADV